MKILHLIATYPPNQNGGSAYSLYRLNCSLDHINKVVLSGNVIKNNLNNYYAHDKMHKVYFHNKFSPFFLLSFLKEFFSSDIIQLSSFFFLPNFYVFILAKFYKKKVIISPRGEFFSYAFKKNKKLKSFFLSFFKFLKLSVYFHVTSNKEYEIINSIFDLKKSSIHKIHNSFEHNKFFNETRLDNILFLGRINPIKNIHCLFSVLKELNNVILTIAGPANSNYEKKYLDFLKKEIIRLKIEKKVKFVGTIYDELKFKTIAKSKILVLPSKSENFGNVVLESLAQQTPVLASYGTPWESLEEYGCGFQINFDDKDELKEKINLLINYQKKDYLKLKKNSKLFLEQFSYIRINNKWRDLYKI